MFRLSLSQVGRECLRIRRRMDVGLSFGGVLLPVQADKFDELVSVQRVGGNEVLLNRVLGLDVRLDAIDGDLERDVAFDLEFVRRNNDDESAVSVGVRDDPRAGPIGGKLANGLTDWGE